MEADRLLVFEVLMGVDHMAVHLGSPEDLDRLVRFVTRLQQHGTPSREGAAKIEDTLSCHLRQSREPGWQ